MKNQYLLIIIPVLQLIVDPLPFPLCIYLLIAFMLKLDKLIQVAHNYNIYFLISEFYLL